MSCPRDADLLDGVENVGILLERDLDRIIERHVGHIRVALLGDEAGNDFSKSAMIIFCCIANFSLSLRVVVSLPGASGSWSWPGAGKGK